uniref:Uncharacterized protein n=1 Tax=Alexandrium catenella TaxID=2925 RepID=A0A7S1QQC6_ALECA
MDPGAAALGGVLAGIVLLGTGLAAVLFALAARLLEARCAASEALLEGVPGAGDSPAPFSFRALSREVSLQLQRQVSVSAPGHAEVVPPEVPEAARPERQRSRSWSGGTEL